MHDPGRHRITIRVDNGESIPPQIRTSSHACVESTQTNWNGIIGRLEFQTMNPRFIERVQIFPSAAVCSVWVKVRMFRDPGTSVRKVVLVAQSFNAPVVHRMRRAAGCC